MDRHWAVAVVQELRALDREEAPHGLYGLRQARQGDGEHLPKLPAILSGPSVRLAHRVGGTLHTIHPSAESMSFGLPGPRTVSLGLRSWADTKIRRFGDTYRLDDSGRPALKPAPDLLRELPGLTKSAQGDYGRNSEARSFGLLLIGHFRRQADAASLFDRFLDPGFLARYDLSLADASWADVHGRNFWSFIRLWYVDQSPRA